MGLSGWKSAPHPHFWLLSRGFGWGWGAGRALILGKGSPWILPVEHSVLGQYKIRLATRWARDKGMWPSGLSFSKEPWMITAQSWAAYKLNMFLEPQKDSLFLRES